MRRGLEIRTRTTAAHHASSSQHPATRPLRDHPTTTTALEPKQVFSHWSKLTEADQKPSAHLR